MKKKLVAGAFILLLCAGSTALAYYGNIRYPDFSGYRPSKPFDNDQYGADRYRREVQNYVNECEQYISNAREDIRTIEKAISYAISEANFVVGEYNRFVRYGN